jgi:1-deoxy-D-xylulose-5-phosphate synthase
MLSTSYWHKKNLTERKDNFHTNRQLGGILISKRSESVYDTFGVEVFINFYFCSIGNGMIVSLLKGENKHHIAVIGMLQLQAEWLKD